MVVQEGFLKYEEKFFKDPDENLIISQASMEL